MSQIHEARHSIYSRECLREQDTGIWVSYVSSVSLLCILISMLTLCSLIEIDVRIKVIYIIPRI